MDQKNETSPAPVEATAAIGFALVLGGRLPELILGIIVWFAIRRVRPATPSPILFVTAMVVAETLLVLFALLFIGQAPSAQFMLEVIAILVVGLLLFFTQARRWAYILLAYCGYSVAARSFELFHGVEHQAQNFYFGAIAARVIMGWMLISFIRPPALPPVTEPNAPTVPQRDVPPVIRQPDLLPIISISTDAEANGTSETARY
jgi:hypothetical protein